MANLLSELLGLSTQMSICCDQHWGLVQRQKIHIIKIIPSLSSEGVEGSGWKEKGKEVN